MADALVLGTSPMGAGSSPVARTMLSCGVSANMVYTVQVICLCSSVGRAED